MTINISRLFRLLLLCGVASIVYMSCVEEYWPELGDNHENLLVVEGQITNESGPYTIKLTRSAFINSPTISVPEINATVTISDNQGNSEILSEVKPGIYETSEGGIQGVIGRKYKISINTTNGSKYESEPEELREPHEISCLKATLENKPVQFEGDTRFEDGIQFYVSTITDSDSKDCLQWQIEETYEYHAKHEIRWIMNEDDDRDSIFSTNDLNKVENPDFLFKCWKSESLDEILVFNGRYQSNDEIEVPINFVSFYTNKTDEKYALTVKQLTISEETYSFLNSIKLQETDQSDLYNTQPFQIRGNVNNIDNDKEPVLGYFVVAGVSDVKRIFVQTPPGYEYIPENNCSYIIEDVFRKLRYSHFPSYPVYVALLDTLGTEDEADDAPVLLPYTPFCIDCRENGGDTILPLYWNDGELYPILNDLNE